MRCRPLAACGLLVGAVGLAYLNAFWGAFQFDDYNVIVDNPAVHSWPGWFQDLQGIRPLLKLSYTLNWTSGLGLFGFHLFNVSVHAANAVMAYLLFRRLRDEGSDPAEAPAPALAAALLFAVHPVQTEAVTYVSGRSASLMAFFYLASLLAYARGRESGSRLWLQAVSPLTFLLAFLTKETAVTLPLALVLWEIAGPLRRTSGFRVLQWQAAHWAMLGAIVGVLSVHQGYFSFLSSAFGTRGLEDNLLSQIDGVCYLLLRLVWPIHLNIDPALPVASRWTWQLAGKALLLLSLLAGGVASLGRRRYLAFGILWFFLHLLPTNSLVPRLDVANERQIYLAGGGLFLAASTELGRIRAAGRLNSRWSQAAAACLLVVLTLLTIVRNHDYRSEVALWESAVGQAPSSARAYNNLGYAYALRGDRRKAREAYLAALRLKPDYDLAKNNLSALGLGRLEQR